MKQSYIILIIIVLAAALGLGIYNSFTEPQESTPAEVTTDASMETSEPTQLENIENDDGTLTIGLTSQNTEVRYIAQKVFFNKPTQEIIGINQDVSGTVTVDLTENIAAINVTIPVNGFETGNESRDNDVVQILGDTVKVTADSVDVTELVELNSSSTIIPLQVMINGAEETVNFAITGNREGETVRLNGTADITMSDFNVDPPSLLNVYTVEEELTIEFDTALDI